MPIWSSQMHQANCLWVKNIRICLLMQTKKSYSDRGSKLSSIKKCRIVAESKSKTKPWRTWSRSITGTCPWDLWTRVHLAKSFLPWGWPNKCILCKNSWLHRNRTRSSWTRCSNWVRKWQSRSSLIQGCQWLSGAPITKLCLKNTIRPSQNLRPIWDTFIMKRQACTTCSMRTLSRYMKAASLSKTKMGSGLSRRTKEMRATTCVLR